MDEAETPNMTMIIIYIEYHLLIYCSILSKNFQRYWWQHYIGNFFGYTSDPWLSIRTGITLAQYNNENVTFNWLNSLANCFGITNKEQLICLLYSKYCDHAIFNTSLIQIERRFASIFAVKMSWDLISTKNSAYLYGIDNSKYILEDNWRIIKSHYTKYPGNSQNWNHSTECLRGRPKEQWMIWCYKASNSQETFKNIRNILLHQL